MKNRRAACLRLAGLAAAGFLTLSGTTPAGAQELTWADCGDDAAHADAECAHIVLPLQHDDPAAGTINVALGRILSAAPMSATRTQFWYLPGGPGDSGVETLGRLHAIFGELGVDIYSLDHRGVRGTALLRCPEQEAEDSEEGRELSTEEWPACIEWLGANRPDLDYLTATASARDVSAAINATRGPGDRVIIFGASYGTYWANRYLTLFPDQPDGVILDGIVPADWTFAEFDDSLDQVGRSLLNRCVRDAECAGHLGPDPISLAQELPDRFDAGHCPDISGEVDGRTLRLVLGNMLMSGPEVWPYIPAMVYRMDRCKIRDLEAAGSLFETLFDSGEVGEPESHSPVLQRHVSMSELWPTSAPRAEQFEAAIGRSTMTTAVSASFATTYDDWPRYPRPESAGLIATYSGPMLLLHGGLDPTMPVDRLSGLVEHFSGPGQEFVLFPDSGHVTLNENECARSMYESFIKAPGEPVDRTCMAAVAGIAFAAPDTDEPLFGTDDFWGESATTMEIGVIILNLLIAAAMAGTVLWVARWMRRRRSAGAAE